MRLLASIFLALAVLGALVPGLSRIRLESASLEQVSR